MKNKAIEKAARDRETLAASYGVPVSAVVWIGNNKYIVIKDGKKSEFEGGRGRMKHIKRFIAWIFSGDALTVQEAQKRLVLYSELM